MTLKSIDTEDAELQQLRAMSAEIGGDRLLVQAAGGNTSVKHGDTLWIKASGTWLAHALTSDIMVPVSMPPLLDAVARAAPEAEKAEAFALSALNPGGLRPSIETTVHALMPQRVVVHVHCVDTIATAVRADAEAVAGDRLRGMNWAFVPYCRPGLPLARAIAERIKPDTDVLVLGSHGLVVAADTVDQAALLLRRASGLLAREVRPAPEPDIDALLRLAAGSDYRLPEFAEAHRVATDLVSCRIAAPGSLYPDHVIFLGEGSVVAGPKDTAQSVAEAGEHSRPMAILFPGKGILMRRDANAGAEALARCLADVTARIDLAARVSYLTPQDNHDLLNWDAEKYRQALNRQTGTLQ